MNEAQAKTVAKEINHRLDRHLGDSADLYSAMFGTVRAHAVGAGDSWTVMIAKNGSLVEGFASDCTGRAYRAAWHGIRKGYRDLLAAYNARQCQGAA